MYTWGYIRNAALAKLDLTSDEATVANMLGRFVYYANEVITQVSSAIKPKKMFWTVEITRDNVNKLLTIEDPDFIGFGDDVCTVEVATHCGTFIEECYDTDLVYKGYNQFICTRLGVYSISYNARWYTFNDNIDDNEQINVPNDILDCIPSYIASQCYKIDDEYKASVFRNEYEMALARIDNTDFANTKTFHIRGGW